MSSNLILFFTCLETQVLLYAENDPEKTLTSEVLPIEHLVKASKELNSQTTGCICIDGNNLWLDSNNFPS